MTRPGFLARCAFLVLLLAIEAAVLWQDFGGALPAGLFNEGAGALHRLSWVLLVAVVCGWGKRSSE